MRFARSAAMRARLALAATLLFPLAVAADPLALERDVTSDDDTSLAMRVDEGALDAWTLAPVQSRGAVLASLGGYDAAQDRPMLSSTLAMTPHAGVTLHVALDQPSTVSDVHPSFGALVGVLRQQRVGVDLAVGAEYASIGWNGVPAAIARIAAARSFGTLRLQANAAFGLGVVEGERYGDLRASALQRIGTRMWLGLDSRARVDLERDDDEPEGEASWDLQAGPSATYRTGPVALTALAGISALQLRAGGGPRLGPLLALGLGTAF
jgi:hypothetical protein